MKKIKAENLQKGKCYAEYHKHYDTAFYYFFKVDSVDKTRVDYSCYHQEIWEEKTRISKESDILIEITENKETISKTVKVNTDTYEIYDNNYEFIEVKEDIIDYLKDTYKNIDNRANFAREYFNKIK